MRLSKAIIDACDRIRRRWRTDSRKGSAAIEFAMVAPVFFLFLFGIIETGVIFFGSAMLQNATDDTARRIRTGQLSGTLTASQVVAQVCSEISGLITTSQCTSNLQVDVRSFSSFGGSSYPSVTKSDGTIDLSALKVQSAGVCSVVLVRTFYPWTIMTPLMSPLLENTGAGQYILSAASAFRTEPFQANATC